MSWFSLVIGQNASHQLATSSENLVTSAQFLVALATSESQFRALHPIISLTDKLLALKSKPQNISKEDVSCFLWFTLDSLTLISHSVYEANLIRRELIRPDLNEHYKQLCSSQTPISKFLFGDDLPKAVKEISQTNKVSQQVSYSKHGTFSKHGSNNFKRQGSYPNRQNHFWPKAKDDRGNHLQNSKHTKEPVWNTQSSS